MLRGIKKGFTIIELLIVIVVVALLAALVLNRVGGATENARDEQRKSDLTDISEALDNYQIAEQSYPSEAHMEDNAWVTENLSTLDASTLIDPMEATINTDGGYQYTSTPTDCDTGCTGYSLSADLEEDGRDTDDTDENPSDVIKQS